MPKLKLEGLTKKYGKVLAVNDLNLETRDVEFLVVVGPSGCGKTTMLRMIAGLEEPDSGNIYIDHELMNDVPVGKRGVQMIFQNFALWPHMKVMDKKKYTNLNFALKIRKWLDKDIKERVDDITQKVGIKDEWLSRKPNQLSAGQQQRVAIGRAIMIPPRIFLMDEPMSSLDPPSRVHVRQEIVQVHKQLGTTTIYVTHNMADAMAMADRIALMNEGHILQIGTSQELYYHPVSSFVADFFRSYEPSFPGKAHK